MDYETIPEALVTAGYCKVKNIYFLKTVGHRMKYYGLILKGRLSYFCYCQVRWCPVAVVNKMMMIINLLQPYPIRIQCCE